MASVASRGRAWTAALALSLWLSTTAAHMDLYNPLTGMVDHTAPNKKHADALRKVRAALKTDPGRAMIWWEGDEPCKTPWVGVRCVQGNDVTHLDLSRRGIGGDLDPAIAEIETLVELNLSNNFITGQVPASLGSMPNLRALNLHNNRLMGTIPPELGNSTSLRFIGLHQNRIEGTIPKELAHNTKLSSLDLAVNRLTGSIPPELGNVTGLWELHLGRNKLNGTIPSELVGCYNLQYLRMQGNMLEGTVPDNWGSSFYQLWVLDLSRNLLHGDVPTALAEIPALRELWLNHNQIYGTTPAALKAKNISVLVRCIVRMMTVAASLTTGALHTLYEATKSAVRRGLERSGVRRGRDWFRRQCGSRDENVAGGEPDSFDLDQWAAAEAHDPLSERSAQRLRLASRESRHSTNVIFKNATAWRARIYWVNYQGEHVRYKTLEPGQAHRQQTFETHPWTFTTVPVEDATPRRRLVVEGGPVFFPTATSAARGGRGGERARTNRFDDDSDDDDGIDDENDGGGRVFYIEQPPIRRWTHEGHKDFPSFFKQVSRTFLLSHARLRRRAALETVDALPITSETCRRTFDKDEDETGGHIQCPGVQAMGPAAHDDECSAMEWDTSHGHVVGAWAENDEAAGGGKAVTGSGATAKVTTLGDLPSELVAYVLKLAAPSVPVYAPIKEPSVGGDVSAEEAGILV